MSYLHVFNGTFENNSGGLWGAIQVSYNSDIINSTFINNTAAGGGAIYYDGYIRYTTPSNDTYSNITGSSFINNNATEGGAILIGNIPIIKNSDGSIIFNYTGDGDALIEPGAYAFHNASAIIKNNVFDNNSATNGGTIRIGGNAKTNDTNPLNKFEATLINNTIIGSSAENGGAIFNDENGTIIADNNTLTNNTAKNNGGTINNQGNATITNNDIIDNNATNGAGIYNNGTLISENNTISGNIADRIGGAIDNDGNMSSAHDTIVNNTAEHNSGAINNNGNLTVDNSSIDDNYAGRQGGGVYNDANGTLSINGSTINNNTAERNGGGLNNQGNMTITNNNLTNNNATNGAGIYNNGRLISENNTINGNDATENGGGLNNQGNAILTNNNLTDNNATNGAGIYNNGTLVSENNTISGNNATGNGGGVNTGENSNSTINNSNVGNNTAGENGGGTNTETGGNTTVNNSTIGNNTAGNNGAGVNNNGTTNLNNTNVTGNNATENGGGVNTGENGNTNIDNGNVGNNTAGENSGGINNNGNTTLNNTDVSDNNATNGTNVHNNGTLVIDNSTVEKLDVVLNVDPVRGFALDNVTINVRVYDSEGNPVNGERIAFKVNDITLKDSTGKTIQVTVSNGLASLDIQALESWMGTDTTLEVIFTGTSLVNTGRNTSTDINITSRDATLTVTAPNTYINGTLDLTATVTDQNGSPVNVGYVIFKLNGKTLRDTTGKTITAEVVNGIAKASYQLPFNYGAYERNITAVFTHKAYNKIENTTKTKLMPIPIILGSNNVQIKDEYTRPTITAQLYNRQNGALLTGTQKVSIKFDGKSYIATMKNGIINETLPVDIYRGGQHTVEIAIGTSSHYDTLRTNITTPTTQKYTVKTTNITTTVSGNTTRLRASIVDQKNSKLTKDVKVNIKINGVSFANVVASKGTLNVNLNRKVKSTDVITITTSENAYYKSSITQK